MHMFREFFIFDAPAIVLATEARLGFFQGKRVPWERGCTVYYDSLYSSQGSSPLSVQDGGGGGRLKAIV